MILIDTSVWIDFLRQKNNPKIRKLKQIFDLHIPYGITGQIYQEVLQGALNENDFRTLKMYLDSFRIYSPLHEKNTYEAAAGIFFACKKKGITIRSTTDCLIAQIAREHHLKLLHNDKDFDAIKKIVEDLEFL